MDDERAVADAFAGRQCGFVPQEYLSVDKRYYEPKEIGYEARIRERVDYWRALRDFVREEKRDGKA